MRNFCDIINTQDYKYLLKNPNQRVDSSALEIWGEILLEYAELDGNNSVKDKFEKTVELRALQNAYTTIKAMIRLVWMVSPSNEKFGNEAAIVVDDLRKMGYKIDTSSSDRYRQSLVIADQRSNSLVTFIQMKKNELKGDHDESQIDYDEIMSMLSLHFKISEDITVSRYCACKKTLKKQLKNQPQKY